jgi:hypothetical protein
MLCGLYQNATRTDMRTEKPPGFVSQHQHHQIYLCTRETASLPHAQTPRSQPPARCSRCCARDPHSAAPAVSSFHRRPALYAGETSYVFRLPS